MKKLIVSIFVLIIVSQIVHAQSFKKDYQLKEVYQLIDSLGSKVYKIDSSNLEFKNQHGVNFILSNEVILCFDRYASGYNLRKISGSFEPVFILWKNRFDNGAEAAKIEASGYAIKSGTKRAHFQRMTDKKTWWITQR